MNTKFLLTVTVPAGWQTWALPRPQSQGNEKRRALPVGKQLYAYDIALFEGVPYANLVPLDPQKPEWARVGEAGYLHYENGKLVANETIQHYAEAFQMDVPAPVNSGDTSTVLANTITALTAAVGTLTSAVLQLVAKTK